MKFSLQNVQKSFLGFTTSRECILVWLGKCGEEKNVLWVCDFVAAVGLMLLKSSHHWKVISNMKSQPQQSTVKEGWREERIKRRHQRGGKERRTQERVDEEEEEEEQVCQSCLLIGWRCTENKRQTQPAVTFQITPRHTNTHLHTYTHGKRCRALWTTFKEMSPWDSFKSVRQHKNHKHKHTHTYTHTQNTSTRPSTSIFQE